MALIKDKKAFIGAVATIIAVDDGAQKLLFPKARPRKAKLIEYDYATVANESAAYHSFAKTSNPVEKDGKNTIKLAPINFNESISKDEIYANAEQFGENEYGDGKVDAKTESALTGVGKLALRTFVGTKRAMYEALTLHKITDGYEGKDGKEDIVFNTPATNKRLLTNDGDEKYWSDTANSKPLTNMRSVYNSMLVKPSSVIMNNDTYANFYDSVEVLTVDNTSEGKKRNYILNENADTEADFFKAGRVMFKGMNIDVYVERGTYSVGGTDTQYLDPKYAVFASKNNGTTEFGGIPVAKKGGVENIAAEVDIEEVITQNPPQHEVIYRTAPLPLMKNGNAFYSLQVEA